MRPDTTPRKTVRAPLAVMAGVLAIAALAGCIGIGDDLMDTLAPSAVLDTDRDERWVGESFTFDATASSTGEADRALLSFDLGDGTIIEMENESEAIVHHAYKTGGVYTVNLTIVTFSTDGENRTATTQVRVAVHERLEGRELLLQATPIAGPIAQGAHPFPVKDGATLWEADAHLEGTSLVGATEATVRILSPDNDTLAEEQVSLEPGENMTVRFSGEPMQYGTYTLNVTVESGSLSFESLMRVYYDADAADAA